MTTTVTENGQMVDNEPPIGGNIAMTPSVGQSNAIARASDDAFRFALEPRNFEEMWKFCAVVAKTQMCGVKTPEEAMVRLMTGRQLGIPSFVALQHVYDVYGRPGLSAKLKVALCLRHPDCEYFEHVESDTKHAVYRAKRRGRKEVVVRWDIDDANRAQLVKKDSNYEKHPRRMFQARASSELADIVFSDATMGMPTVDEAREAHDNDGEIIAEVVAHPVQAQPLRDFAAETEALKTEIATCPPEGRRALRARMQAFAEEAGEPYVTEIRAAYNATLAPKQATTSAPVAPELFGK